jgi:hypothetical protein
MVKFELDTQCAKQPTAQLASTRFTMALSIVAAGGVGSVLAVVHQGEPAAIVIAVGSMVLVAAGSIILTSTGPFRSSLTRMELTPWWVAYTLLSFGLTSLAWLTPKRGTSAIIHQASIPGAVVAVTAFVAAVTFGWLAGHRSVFHRPLRRLAGWSLDGAGSRFRTPNVPILVYLIGLTSRLVRVGLGRYAYLGNASKALSAPSSANQLLSNLELFTRFAIVLLLLDAFVVSRSVRSRVLLIGAFMVEIGFAAVSGVKGELVTLLFALGIGLVASGRRIRLKSATVCAAAFLLLVPINLAYREEIIRTTSINSQSPLSVIRQFPEIASAALRGQNPVSTSKTSTAFVAERLREIDNLAIIMQRTPAEIPYRPTSELVVGPAAGLVPRAVWPSKPIVSVGYDFSQQYYNLPSNIYTASAVTVEGDLYRHGGWFVMLLGGGIFGVVMRAIQDVFYPGRDQRLALFYCALFLLLTNVEVDVVSSVTSVVELVILAAVTTRFCYGQPRNRRAATLSGD